MAVNTTSMHYIFNLTTRFDVRGLSSGQ